MPGPRPIGTPWSQRIRDLTGGPLTIATWVVAVACVVGILAGRAERFEYVGLARSIVYEVSSSATARLDSVLVGVYEDVDKGEILVTFDDAAVRARLAEAAALAKRLDAELELAELRLARGADAEITDWQSDRRRFEVDAERRRAEVLSVMVEIESDELEEQRLRLRARRVGELHDSGVASAEEYDDARLQHAEVVRRLERNRLLLAQLEADSAAADVRRNRFARGDVTDAELNLVLAPLRARLEAQMSRVAEVEAEREALILRSPIRGRVTRVDATRGKAVVAGDPVVSLVSAFATEVVAYVPAARRLSGDIERVTIARSADPSLTVESVVLRISPTIEELPQRLWRRAGIREYGRALVLAAVAPLELIPGEVVRVRIVADD